MCACNEYPKYHFVWSMLHLLPGHGWESLGQPHPTAATIGRTLFDAEDPLVTEPDQTVRSMDTTALSTHSTPYTEKQCNDNFLVLEWGNRSEACRKPSSTLALLRLRCLPPFATLGRRQPVSKDGQGESPWIMKPLLRIHFNVKTYSSWDVTLCFSVHQIIRRKNNRDY